MQQTTSQARIDANRLNAQLSTGPRTEEGKQASSSNATKHGFFSRIGPAEEPAFREMLIGLYHSFRPKDEIQQMLVDQIGLAYLRLSRLYQLELNTQHIARNSDADSAHSTQHAALRLRYETMLNRQIERNVKLLWEVKERRNSLGARADLDPPFLPDFTPVAPAPVAESTLHDLPSGMEPGQASSPMEETTPAPELDDAPPPQAPIPAGPLPRAPEHTALNPRPSTVSAVLPEGSRRWPYDPRPLADAARRIWRR